MTLAHRSLIIIVLGLLGCASRPEASSDRSGDSAAATHDPSLHAQHTAASGTGATGDSTFAALQARGAAGMGVDQYTSTHTFEPRPDGGRITLRRDVDDTAGVAQIRAHLETIAAAFAAGDFATPAFVHSGAVPGADIMAARRALISYSAGPIPRGGELIIQTSDSVALDAVHRFLAFQRQEHRAGGGASVPPPR
jgi:hypothetical protein